MLEGSGDFATLIVSPGAILAAVAPEVIVFQASAQVDPSFESFPLAGSRQNIVICFLYSSDK